MTYLADTSAVVRLRHGRDIAPRWVDMIQAGLVGVCPAVEAELMRAVASRSDRGQLSRSLRSLFAWHPMPDVAIEGDGLLTVVALGLETESDLDVTLVAGCQFGQGELLHGPVPSERLEAYLESHRSRLF